MEAKRCDHGGSLPSRSPIALRHAVANAFVIWIDLRAQRNGRHADANERRFCQPLTGVPQSNAAGRSIPPFNVGESIQHEVTAASPYPTLLLRGIGQALGAELLGIVVGRDLVLKLALSKKILAAVPRIIARAIRIPVAAVLPKGLPGRQSKRRVGEETRVAGESR